MRIGLFSDTYLPELNGVASSVGILKNALESIGHEVYVITTKPDGYDVSQDDANVIRLNGIELKSLYGYVLTSPVHFMAFETVKSKQLDVIHAHTEFGVGIFARICASMLKIPLVSTYHTTYEDYTHYLNPVGLEGVEKVAKVAVSKLSKLYGDSSVEVIAPSEKTKAMLLRYNIRSSIHVIPTGLPLERFKSENTSAERIKEIRDQYGVKDNEFLITYLGRVAKEKNIGFVIDGFSKIKEKQLPCKLLIVGGGPDEEDLHKQVVDLGLSDYVSFAGRQPREAVPSFYHASNAFISASTSETQGMTYIEALASGLPVFAYKDPVLDEIIVENESGYFFTSEEEMIAKLESFVNLSDEDRQAFIERCLAKAAPYSMDIFASRVERVYQSAISNFERLYIINQVRTKDEEVQVSLITPQGDELKVLVSLQDYFDYGFRKNAKLTKTQVDALVDHEVMVKAYQRCIRKLTNKDRSRKEIEDMLAKETECSESEIQGIIEKLEQLGYVDDYSLTQEIITTQKASLMGKNRILKALKSRGISDEMATTLLENRSGDEAENAKSYAEKIRRTIHDKSLTMKKKAMYQQLISKGYSSEVANDTIASFDFSEETEGEMENCKKCALKARKRYENKYEGSKLKSAIFKYCMSNGFNIEDIYTVLDEMEWN